MRANEQSAFEWLKQGGAPVRVLLLACVLLHAQQACANVRTAPPANAPQTVQLGGAGAVAEVPTPGADYAPQPRAAGQSASSSADGNPEAASVAVTAHAAAGGLAAQGWGAGVSLLLVALLNLGVLVAGLLLAVRAVRAAEAAAAAQARESSDTAAKIVQLPALDRRVSSVS